METKTKRILLFLIGCIGVRFLLVVLAKKSSTRTLKYLGYTALLPALGFALIYLFGWRKTGAEVFGDRIWWNNLRPVHSLLYFLFAYLAINGNRNSWMVLLIDVTIGLVAFVNHHKLLN